MYLKMVVKLDRKMHPINPGKHDVEQVRVQCITCRKYLELQYIFQEQNTPKQIQPHA